ncbi:hypothetical protein LLEC1_01092 [Akanthomyces lecanii]|uniref:proline--tRNA ligase n=1 Tax=Cordyceps confragosa TaxID=2714763 RepID=A0A179I8C8_CORDF|nr:hypothetical protein LLEC1_01092 [Akanthomyces lecanii]
MQTLIRATRGRGHAGACAASQHITSIGNARRSRSTLSTIWVPTGGITETGSESGHDKLIRAGFLRPSQAGIFHLLPLGLRVQKKIEKIIDRHMESIGASRLSLSTITSEELWKKSDRLNSVAPELFRLTDRKEVSLMLSPTHEEEITTLVANTVQSYKDLPLRLYQITRKYRDEMRPRQGLLRSREFVMKDLYTFDVSAETAIETYEQVQAAYKAIFDEMKIPILVAEASSGDMGGNHSHEYHLADATGEDTVAHCTSCGYTANDEVAKSRSKSHVVFDTNAPSSYGLWRGITKDRNTLINAWYPQSNGGCLNLHAVKDLVPELDTSVHDPLPLWDIAVDSPDTALVNIVDGRLATSFGKMHPKLSLLPEELRDDFVGPQFSTSTAASGEALNLLALAEGDGCPRCESGTLKVHRALELGHTFYLGTRYSKPLDALVSLPDKPSQPVPIQMGCFGIGVSRIFGAVAESGAEIKGLNWPRAISPYEVAVIPSSAANCETLAFFDSLTRSGTLDAVLDDRKKAFGWKMTDADMTGYPVVVILGKAWRECGVCEVQCRSLELKQEVAAEELPQFLEKLLQKLKANKLCATVNLDTLEPQQLAQVKKQLDEELEHLTSSFAQLHGAQGKFKECMRCVNSRSESPKSKSQIALGHCAERTWRSRASQAAREHALKWMIVRVTDSNEVLVPLTNSLYVRGELTNTETVLVDIGTGFLVEKKLKSAATFYENKIKELTNSLKELEAIVQQKQMNVRTIEEVLRQKMMAQQPSQSQ